jgi:hypothetical protein
VGVGGLVSRFRGSQARTSTTAPTAEISALVKRGDLVAIKLGGRGQWRIERSKLEEFIRLFPVERG